MPSAGPRAAGTAPRLSLATILGRERERHKRLPMRSELVAISLLEDVPAELLVRFGVLGDERH